MRDETKDTTQDEQTPPPATFREYMQRVNLDGHQFVTGDMLAGALEYFQLVPAPDTHADSPIVGAIAPAAPATSDSPTVDASQVSSATSSTTSAITTSSAPSTDAAAPQPSPTDVLAAVNGLAKQIESLVSAFSK